METSTQKCVHFAPNSKRYDGLSQTSAAVEQIVHMAFVLRTLRSPEDLDKALACIGMLGNEQQLQTLHIAAYKHMLALIDRLSQQERGKSSVVWPKSAESARAAPQADLSRKLPSAVRASPQPSAGGRKRQRDEAQPEAAHMQRQQSPAKCANRQSFVCCSDGSQGGGVIACNAGGDKPTALLRGSQRPDTLREEEDPISGSIAACSRCASNVSLKGHGTHLQPAADVVCSHGCADAEPGDEMDVGSPSTDDDDAASGSTDNPSRSSPSQDDGWNTGVRDFGAAAIVADEVECADGTPVLPAGGGRAMKITTAHLPWLVKLARLQYFHIQARHSRMVARAAPASSFVPGETFR